MLFASWLMSHFSRVFGEKTTWNWAVLFSEHLKQVHGIAENSCTPSENDSRCRFLLTELVDFRDFASMSHFSERFGQKTTVAMNLSRVRTSHRTTWHSWKLLHTSWKPIFRTTRARFRIPRMWTVGTGWKERFHKGIGQNHWLRRPQCPAGTVLVLFQILRSISSRWLLLDGGY